jgi:hypothetical protein
LLPLMIVWSRKESRQARTISNTMPNFGGRRITRSKNAMVQPYPTLSLGRCWKVTDGLVMVKPE